MKQGVDTGVALGRGIVKIITRGKGDQGSGENDQVVREEGWFPVRLTRVALFEAHKEGVSSPMGTSSTPQHLRRKGRDRNSPVKFRGSQR